MPSWQILTCFSVCFLSCVRECYVKYRTHLVVLSLHITLSTKLSWLCKVWAQTQQIEAAFRTVSVSGDQASLEHTVNNQGWIPQRMLLCQTARGIRIVNTALLAGGYWPWLESSEMKLSLYWHLPFKYWRKTHKHKTSIHFYIILYLYYYILLICLYFSR